MRLERICYHARYQELPPNASISGAAGGGRERDELGGAGSVKKSRPGQRPRQRRPLHTMLGSLELVCQEKGFGV